MLFKGKNRFKLTGEKILFKGKNRFNLTREKCYLKGKIDLI